VKQPKLFDKTVAREGERNLETKHKTGQQETYMSIGQKLPPLREEQGYQKGKGNALFYRSCIRFFVSIKTEPPGRFPQAFCSRVWMMSICFRVMCSYFAVSFPKRRETYRYTHKWFHTLAV
jgi:hypothetical protein